MDAAFGTSELTITGVDNVMNGAVEIDNENAVVAGIDSAGFVDSNPLSLGAMRLRRTILTEM